MDRETANVTARKEQRMYNVRIGREGHRAFLHRPGGTVVQAREHRIVKGPHEDLSNQILHEPPAAAMGQLNNLLV